MQIQSQTFTVSEAAQASGASTDSIKNWTKQGVMVGRKEIGGGGSAGRKRTYTFNSVMEIAVANALLTPEIVGMKSVPYAFHAAGQFAHFGSDIQFPGIPHHHNNGETYLFVSGKAVEVALVKTGEIPSPFHDRSQKPIGYVAINVTRLFLSVCQNIPDCPDGRVVLDEIYPEAATA